MAQPHLNKRTIRHYAKGLAMALSDLMFGLGFGYLSLCLYDVDRLDPQTVNALILVLVIYIINRAVMFFLLWPKGNQELAKLLSESNHQIAPSSEPAHTNQTATAAKIGVHHDLP